jgi:hypothetical protein
MHRGPGSLTVVGVGLNGPAQTTEGAIQCMTSASRLIHLVTDPLVEWWVSQLNPVSESLHPYYSPTLARSTTYSRMAGRIVECVRSGEQVCAAFYGHPGVLVMPSHIAVRRVRRLGLVAKMFPGVSADGCLFADLGVNPGDAGMQSYEATDFLLRRRIWDPTAGLLLWQIGVLGDGTAGRTAAPAQRLGVLAKQLRRAYGARHRVTLYQAATFPSHDPEIQTFPIDDLPRRKIAPLMTLYIPPISARPADRKILRWLSEP